MKNAMKAVMVFVAALLVAAPAWADGISVRGLLDPVIVDESRPLIDLTLNIHGDETLAYGKEKATSARKRVDELSQDWGGFGGPLLMYFQLDREALDPMTRDRGVDRFESDMLLIGGLGGLIYQDFRFGGFGFGNSQDTADRTDDGFRRSADMSMGGGGIFMELNRTVTPNFGLAAGVMLGAGNIRFKASGDDLSLTPGEIGKWKADGSFFMSYPYLGFWLAPVNWMWVQLDAGYLFFDLDTSNSKWKNDHGVKMVDGDLGGGFMAGLKLNFGYNPNAK